MANVGKQTDSERLAGGQYKKDGQWYTSSGHKIKDAYDPGGGSIAQFGGDVQLQQQYKDEQEARKASNRAWNTGEDGRLTILKETGYDVGPNSAYYEYGDNGPGDSKYDPANAQYEKARRAQEEALEEALEHYGGQKAQIEQDADAAARQAYLSKLLSERGLEQQLTAAGWSGGLAESARLRLQTDYEKNRGEILKARDKSLAAVDEAIAEAEESGEAELEALDASYREEVLRLRAQAEAARDRKLAEAAELSQAAEREAQQSETARQAAILSKRPAQETAAAATAAVYKSPLPVTEISEEDFAAQLREYGIVPGTAAYDLWMKDYTARQALAERNAAEANGALTAGTTAGTQKTVPATTQGVANIYSGLTEKQARVLNRALQMEIPSNGLRLIDESDLTEEEQEAVVAAYVSRMGPYMEGREASLAVGAQ